MSLPELKWGPITEGPYKKGTTWETEGGWEAVVLEVDRFGRGILIRHALPEGTFFTIPHSYDGTLGVMSVGVERPELYSLKEG